MQIHNCHIHTFTTRAVPNRALRFRAVSLARNRLFRWGLRGLTVLPFKSLDRLGAFVRIGSRRSQAEIFEVIARFYPDDTKFVVLPMDFEFMEAGKPPQSFFEQLEELEELARRYDGRLLPFVAADPRRADVTDLVTDCLENRGFAGVKLYPPLGYYPFDERLDKVFEYAQERSIPILAHCSRGGVYYKGKITEEMRRHPKSGDLLRERKRKKFTDHFSDPRNYKWVLEKFPQLKICLAHYGGGGEWLKHFADPRPSVGQRSWLAVVSDLMREHPNVYTDVAYTAHDRRLWPELAVRLNTDGLKERILFGSDFYMVRMEVTPRQFSIGLRSFVGETAFKQMAEINAATFLSTT